MQLLLDVAGEPCLQGFGVVGRPLIKKAIDDQGQTLLELTAEPRNLPEFNNNGGGVIIVNGRVMALNDSDPAPLPRVVPVRLKLGDKSAKRLTELSGLFMVQVLKEGEARISVDNILKATGQSAKGKDASVLRDQDEEKLDDVSVRTQVAMEDPAEQNPMGVAGNVRIFVNGRRINGVPTGPANFPKLFDAQGRGYAPTEVSRSIDLNTNQTLLRMLYRPQGEAAQLVLYRQQVVTISVQFKIKYIPLP